MPSAFFAVCQMALSSLPTICFVALSMVMTPMLAKAVPVDWMAPAALPELLETAAGCAHIRVRGLMAIPPVAETSDGNHAYFTKMHELFVDIGRKKYDNVSMDFLSMGMSGDFEDAIAAGANMVRVGSSIFGARDYSQH